MSWIIHHPPAYDTPEFVSWDVEKIHKPENKVQIRENFINCSMLGKVYTPHTALPG